MSRLEQIDPDELAARLEAGDELVVLDVRDADEFAAGHIPGLGPHPLRRARRAAPASSPRGRPIAAVCSGGKRSGLAASILQREGFEHVIHVGKGGVGTWQRAGHPIETGEASRRDRLSPPLR